MDKFANLVSTEWLADNLKNVRIVDSTFYLPTENRDPVLEFTEEHIPGAVFFDIDAIADSSSPLPHMFPNAKQFADALARLGINRQDTVVCYDSGKSSGACRAWWMFRAFSQQKVYVLNGGFLKWRTEKRPTESGQVVSPLASRPGEETSAEYDSGPDPALICDLDSVRAALASGSSQIIDARSRARFLGQAPEPRAGMRSGHMPGAINLPYDELINADGTFKSRSEIRTLFEQAGFDPAKPTITSCGSGVSATTLLMGLLLIGHEDVMLYDGSWSEWGTRQDTPVTAA